MGEGRPQTLVHLDVEGGVATITLDSPHNRNALSARLRAELSESLGNALADEHVRVIVLTHRGPVFCAGMDLKESRGSTPPEEGSPGLPAILEALWTSPKPVLARLAGPARAGGLGLVAACDIAVASDTIDLAFPEVRLGVVPALISVTVLPRMLPRAAHELFLTGEAFDAHRAVEVGLLNAAVPHAELDDEVRRYTALLLRGAPEALAATKEVLRTPPTGSVGEQLAAMDEVSTRHFSSPEGQEGLRAFAERRRPEWVPPDNA